MQVPAGAMSMNLFWMIFGTVLATLTIYRIYPTKLSVTLPGLSIGRVRDICIWMDIFLAFHLIWWTIYRCIASIRYYTATLSPKPAPFGIGENLIQTDLGVFTRDQLMYFSILSYQYESATFLVPSVFILVLSFYLFRLLVRSINNRFEDPNIDDVEGIKPSRHRDDDEEEA